MSKPYDATTKDLLTERPRDLLAFLGLPAADYEVEAIDADLSTVTAAADKILRIGGPEPSLAHIEAQSGPDQTLDERTLHYNVLTGFRHALPVHSVILLLRKEADSTRLTGNLQKRLPDGRIYLDFFYTVVRVWEKPVEEALSGGLGVLPLAPLCDVTLDEMPGVIARMKERIDTEATREDAGELWTATNVLMGLRYPDTVAEELLKGVRDMEESSTYQAIMRKGQVIGEQIGRQEGEQQGRIEEAQRMVIHIGTRRLGEPSDAIVAQIMGLTLDELENLTDRILEVESWGELFAA